MSTRACERSRISAAAHRRAGAIVLLLACVVAAVFQGAIGSPISAGATRAGYERIGQAPRVPTTFTRLGVLSLSQQVSFEVDLEPARQAGLVKAAAAVAEPQSSSYRHYLSRRASAQQFEPAFATVRRVERSLADEGLTGGRAIDERLVIDYRASVATIDDAFALHLVRYRQPGGGIGFSNDAAPRVPRSIAPDIADIEGLDSLAPEEPEGVSVGVASLRPHATGCPTNQPGAAYTPSGIASVYDFGPYAPGTRAPAAGVGLVELAAYGSADLSNYERCFSSATASVRRVRVPGGSLSTEASYKLEADLDVEMVAGLAPSAPIVVYEAAPTNFLGAIAAAVSADQVRVISISFGSCEAAILAYGDGRRYLEDEQALFEQAAAQGQSVVVSSGDSGAQGCSRPGEASPDTRLSVSDPASQPWVTAVGGTALGTSSGTPLPAEATWNASPGLASNPALGNITGASGGGASAMWPMPAYQSGLAGALTAASQYDGSATCSASTCREVPDVAANSGTGYWIACAEIDPSGCGGSGFALVGGTSAAAPLWGALLGLADSSGACRTDGPVGFANPDLYAIAASSSTSASFDDIVVGNNDYTQTSAARYAASAGYDMATGLGSPDLAGTSGGNGLVGALCPVASSTAVPTSSPPATTTTVPSSGNPSTSPPATTTTVPSSGNPSTGSEPPTPTPTPTSPAITPSKLRTVAGRSVTITGLARRVAKGRVLSVWLSRNGRVVRKGRVRVDASHRFRWATGRLPRGTTVVRFFVGRQRVKLVTIVTSIGATAK